MPINTRRGYNAESRATARGARELTRPHPVSSPMAAAILPRYVNGGSDMQAASPLRDRGLFSIIGVGVDVLRGSRWCIFRAGLSAS